MSFETLDLIADCYNPILALSAICFCLIHSLTQKHKGVWMLSFAGEITVYLTIVYGLRYMDTKFDLWPSQGWDYSTHTAFALAMIWPLWLYQGNPWRWAWPVSFIPYAILMLYQGYHTLFDITSTIAVLTILIAGLQRVIRPQTLYFPEQKFV